jgi:hypothetical protein
MSRGSAKVGRKSVALWLAPLVLLGCAEEPLHPPAGAPVTSLGQIRGAWDIARLDGYQPMRLKGGVRRAYLDISGDSIGYSLGCAFSGSAARIDASATLQGLSGLPASRSTNCDPSAEARENQLSDFMSTRPRVQWGPNSSLRLSNGRSELLLERPPHRRLAHLPSPTELSGRWNAVSAIESDNGVGFSAVPFPQPSPVEITPASLTFAGCGGVRFTFTLRSKGQLDGVQTEGQPRCLDSAGATLVAVMTNDPLVERDAMGLALTAGSWIVVLERQAPVRQPPSTLAPAAAQADQAPPAR